MVVWVSVDWGRVGWCGRPPSADAREAIELGRHGGRADWRRPPLGVAFMLRSIASTRALRSPDGPRGCYCSKPGELSGMASWATLTAFSQRGESSRRRLVRPLERPR